MEHVDCELVVLTWPLGTGTCVVEPQTQTVIADWNLSALLPGSGAEQRRLLDPRLSYRPRAEQVVAELTRQQQLLQDALLDGERSVEVRPVLSAALPAQLESFCERHNLAGPAELRLDNLSQLLWELEHRPVEAHRELLCDWYETFVAPGLSCPLRVDARLYGAVSPDQKFARELWLDELAELALSEMSLWTVLRVHYGWRTEFPKEPRPDFGGLLDELDGLLG